MVKKLKELAEDKELANAVRSSAQQIWQAGLGAFAEVSLFSAASAFLVNSSASAVIPAIEYARAQLRQIIA